MSSRGNSDPALCEGCEGSASQLYRETERSYISRLEWASRLSTLMLPLPAPKSERFFELSFSLFFSKAGDCSGTFRTPDLGRSEA